MRDAPTCNEILAEVRRRAMEMVRDHDTDAVKVKAIVSIVQKERDQDFARHRFEHDAAQAALREAARLQAIQNDPALATDEARITAARRVLFGELPDEATLPDVTESND